MTPMDYIEAARVPASVKEIDVFPWQIIRRKLPCASLGFETQTMLCRWSSASMHMDHGEIVMDDSLPELRRHLPIWMKAQGRVLKTGLGLGCVVRGLLLKDQVSHIDVVEIDQKIIAAIGPEFQDNPRVTIHHANAHDWNIEGRSWDFIWHDIHDNDENEHLSVQHARLMMKYQTATPIKRQGAWAFPRPCKRQVGCML
jgi:hypothetical protein